MTSLDTFDINAVKITLTSKAQTRPSPFPSTETGALLFLSFVKEGAWI
jgi:hypothetical protein